VIIFGKLGHGVDGFNYANDGAVELDDVVAVQWLHHVNGCWVWLRGNGTRFFFEPSTAADRPYGMMEPGPEPGSWTDPKLVSSSDLLKSRFAPKKK